MQRMRCLQRMLYWQLLLEALLALLARLRTSNQQAERKNSTSTRNASKVSSNASQVSSKASQVSQLARLRTSNQQAERKKRRSERVRVEHPHEPPQPPFLPCVSIREHT